MRYGLTGSERLLVYRTAIATGYRADELRRLTRGAVCREGGRIVLRLDGNGTENGKEARLDIRESLAVSLEGNAAADAKRRNLLRLPQPTDMARMLRWDLTQARDAWIAAADDDEGRKRRASSDFLAAVDAAGERLDFHALR